MNLHMNSSILYIVISYLFSLHFVRTLDLAEQELQESSRGDYEPRSSSSPSGGKYQSEPFEALEASSRDFHSTRPSLHLSEHEEKSEPIEARKLSSSELYHTRTLSSTPHGRHSDSIDPQSDGEQVIKEVIPSDHAGQEDYEYFDDEIQPETTSRTKKTSTTKQTHFGLSTRIPVSDDLEKVVHDVGDDQIQNTPPSFVYKVPQKTKKPVQVNEDDDDDDDDGYKPERYTSEGGLEAVESQAKRAKLANPTTQDTGNKNKPYPMARPRPNPQIQTSPCEILADRLVPGTQTSVCNKTPAKTGGTTREYLADGDQERVRAVRAVRATTSRIANEERGQTDTDVINPPNSHQTLNIIDGDLAAPRQFSYIVYLKFRYQYKDPAQQSLTDVKEATGALISPFWVLTSLHIVPKVFVYLRLNPHQNNSYQTESLEIDVEAGTIESGATGGTVQKTVSRHPGAVWCHPKGKVYRDKDDLDGQVWFMMDVALVHLNTEPLQFGAYVNSVPLIEGDFPANHLNCVLVGFAQAQNATNWKLYYARVSAGNRFYCEGLRGRTYDEWPKGYHVCAYGNKGRRGCFGDSGSALVCNVYNRVTYVGVLNGLWTHVQEDGVNCSDAANPFTHYVYCGSVLSWVKHITSPILVTSSGLRLNPTARKIPVFILFSLGYCIKWFLFDS